ncbi:MAG TPA: tRNA (guanosine(37)-N1)-methyltransferase TrmD [Lachnospiraceae bacterium]|nr:tRNA (guanosine(37)-N1)-methyltransferase TrmD [Lachnospiraceae bacterium]
MRFHVLTLFPEMILQGLGTSITGRAMQKGLVSLSAINIRDYADNKHRKVDDYTYGGGAGMLMQAQPVYDACMAVQGTLEKPARVVYMSPQGAVFTQEKAKELAREEDLIILCGHYEGIDERVLEEVVTDEISIGDYVLTGGELPAMVVIDTVSRLIPGVLGNGVSADTDSFMNGLLEYPQYSRPETWRGRTVPAVLLSGDHAKVDRWRKEKSLERTKARRPDLYEKYMEEHPDALK